MKDDNYLKKLRKELIVFFGFFVLTLISGVLAIKNYNLIGASICCLAFLVFNGFNILFNLIIKSTKAIINK